MKNAPKKLISALAALALLALCACSPASESPADSEAAGAEAYDVSPASVSAADSRFTLCFSESDGLNPFTCKTLCNTAVCSLIYEGLFTSDNSFSPAPRLCGGWETDEGTVWRFTLRSGIKMHDGSTLTAQDAVYSILRAKSTRYSARFASVSSVEATGSLTFTVTLSSPNMRFLSLLDTPIVKEDTPEGAVCPVGTGAFVPDFSDGGRLLRAFEGYGEYASLPVRTVYLTETTDALAREFQLGEIDLIYEDAAAENASSLYDRHEKHTVNTTVFQYLGFNTSYGVFASQRMRHALSYTADRDYIADAVYSGDAVPAPYVLSPALYFYGDAQNGADEYSLRSASRELLEIGLADSDFDGVLEMPNVDGTGFYDFSLNFLVNADEPLHTAAAREIAYDIRSIGIDVTLNALPREEYKAALTAGNFDLYYAEVTLTPDFDLRRLLGTGGSLNYGGCSCDGSINGYLTADESTLPDAGKSLCRSIRETAPIVPVLYRSFCVRTARGHITGASPSYSGVLRNFSEWSFIN